MPINKGVKELVAEANSNIKAISAEKAITLHDDPNTVFVDIRDVRELQREGMIPNAFHAPRGMLEFWVDPQSPYFKDIFSDEKKIFLLYCQSSWRSALSVNTLNQMGMTNVIHFSGGFNAWKEAGGEVTRKVMKNDNS